MTPDRRPDLCSDCGEPLEPWDGPPDERPACPECGGTARTIRLGVVHAVKQWTGEHPRWSALGLGASVGGVLVSPLLGPLWGVGVGDALAGVSYWAFKKAIAEGRWLE